MASRNQAELERDLIARYQSGGAGAQEALTRLIELHHNFLVSMARRVAREVDDDLLQEGRMALVHTANTFDLKRNVCFRTHARWHVTNAMRAYQRVGSLIYVPRKRKFLDAKVANLREEGRTNAEIRDMLSIPDDHWQVLVVMARIGGSIDAPLEDGDPSENVVDPEREPDYSKEDLDFAGRVINDVTRTLSARDLSLFENWISEQEPSTVMAKRHGITKSRLNDILAQIRNRAHQRAQELLAYNLE
jgi:RNA polymerase sigma factor (sigma-70 family)